MRDLLAADLLGFQTENDAGNFAEAAVRMAGAERGPNNWLLFGGRRIRLGAFPVEIEPQEFAAIAEDSWLASSVRAAPAQSLASSCSCSASTGSTRPRA